MNSHLQKSIEESLELELRALLKAEYFDRLSFVSIHAPTRGATVYSANV